MKKKMELGVRQTDQDKQKVHFLGCFLATADAWRLRPNVRRKCSGEQLARKTEEKGYR